LSDLRGHSAAVVPQPRSTYGMHVISSWSRCQTVFAGSGRKGIQGKKPKGLICKKLGDDLREERGPGILIDLALEDCDSETEKELPNLVIDGIRNLGEIQRLQLVFGYRFTLIGILTTFDDRWGRIGSTAYLERKLKQSDFIADDQRDSNEETPFGQQVQLCIDRADIIIDNSTHVTLAAFKDKVLRFVDLAAGEKPRSATNSEILMNMAFAASHSSKCLKRHVGAVVVDTDGNVVGVGYNENPLGTNPCVEEPEYSYQCYRDIVRNAHFGRLAERKVLCPVCGKPLVAIQGPPWRCQSCKDQEVKTNLEMYFFPERAMSWCTAVHAEVWAILSAGGRCRGGTLYSTTFPCFQCAEKITQVGIKEIVFTEPYPDPYSKQRLDLAGITLTQFEGVRSASFERMFSRIKPD
jgi:deoxycytidylate deaminase